MTNDEPIIQQEEITPEHIPKEEYIRLAADFENYRKEQARQTAEMAKYASQSVVREMISVMDLVSTAVQYAPQSVKDEVTWWTGLSQVEKHFEETMKRFGVSRIATHDQPFDPATMEAISMIPGGVSGNVASEQQAGYRMHERVVRPARVTVYQ
jgi:molecular chaperone GrpE